MQSNTAQSMQSEVIMKTYKVTIESGAVVATYEVIANSEFTASIRARGLFSADVSDNCYDEAVITMITCSHPDHVVPTPWVL